LADAPKLQVEPAGSPAHTMEGLWLNPFIGVISNETSTLFPGTVETDEGVASTLKSAPRIFTVTVGEVEAAKELLPTYVAVMKSLPAGNDEVVRYALPPERLAEPSLLLPDMNSTDPVGRVEPLVGFTVALRAIVKP